MTDKATNHTLLKTGLIISAFEMRFTIPFLHTARVKYNVNFTSSSVVDIRDKIYQLKENVRSENHNEVHVEYDFILEDVEHIEGLINIIMHKYTELFPTAALMNEMIYVLKDHLRQAETKTPTEIAKEVLTEILTPPQPQNRRRKERMEADAKLKSQERAMKLIRKNSAKNGGK
jgi:hypothetical protein